MSALSSHTVIAAALENSANAWAQDTSPVFSASAAMLRCLTLCSDVQFSLMQLLELEDLAHLDASCGAWRAWLLHPPLLSGLSYSLATDWSVLQLALQSRWLTSLVTAVDQQMFTFTGESDLHFSKGTQAEQQQQCARMLQMLPRCTRLRHLQLNIRLVPQASLDACCTGLAELRSLHFDTHGPDAQLLQSFFRALHPLRALEQLFVQGQSISAELDFSALPLMPRLFIFSLSSGDLQKDTWRCSSAQVQCLAQCRSLSNLFCGSWSPDEREVDDDGQPLLSADQQIAEGIGALVSGWLDAPAAASAASASAESTGAPPVARQTDLDLRTTVMTPAVLVHVSRLTAITEIEPLGWLHDMTDAQWPPLARFSKLRAISLMPHPADRWLKSAHMLPPLLHCTLLQKLSLRRMSLRHEQLHAICTRLPLLLIFTMQQVCIEDCAPLALAPSLCFLNISHCSGLAGSPMQFRSTLPAMAHLKQLHIYEREEQRLTQEDAAPLNAALLARMPKLTPESFKQNLLP